MGFIKTTILGCGSSGGVPRIDGVFGACNPDNPKNYRMRSSIIVEKFQNYEDVNKPYAENVTRVLIDTSPDLRMQFLKNKINRVDALLYTHDHADQTHGIDDLRALRYSRKDLIDCYMDEPTAKSLIHRFPYIFEGNQVGDYPTLLRPKPMPPFCSKFTISGKGGDIEFIPLHQKHGYIDSIGFRYQKAAYCNDVVTLPQESLDMLHGLDYFIVDALRYTPHPTHANLETAMSWINEVKPKQSYLTNMFIDMDYDEVEAKTPTNVTPSYDGLSFVFED